VTNQLEGNGQKKVLLHNYGNRTTFIQTVGFLPYTMNFFDFRQYSRTF